MRSALIALELFLALGALFGGGGMLLSPDGSAMGLPPDMLDGSGFDSFLVPGMLLLLANGVLPVAVAIAELRRESWARYGHVAVGAVLTGWIAIQGVLIGFGHWLQIGYLVMGLIILALGLVALRTADAPGGSRGPAR